MAISSRNITILVLAGLLSPINSFAFDLGRLQINSRLNQPLDAEIEILPTTSSSIEELSIRLASPALFAKRELTRSTLLNEIQFSVHTDQETGRYRLRLRTENEMTEASLTLLIDLAWSQGLLLQEYTLQLKPAADAASSSPDEVSVDYELDPYYTNIGLFFSLTEGEMKQVDIENEGVIYRDLLGNALLPRFLVLEASINPLPILGTYLKDQHDSVFEQADVNDDLNIIQAFTEGFEEPYALSLFVGNVIRFTSSRSRIFRAVNKGYSGFLLSIGDQHIKDSELFDDNWYEIEWKIKGDRRIESVYHSWSFRIGSKIHDNPNISDVNYLGFRRELFNEKPGEYAWYENIGVDYSIFFSRKNGDAVQHQVFVEKRWPKSAGEFSLGIGLNKFIDKYSGELADEDSETRLILRPGFSF